MTHRLFEERDHAALYQKYRFSPPGEVKDFIIQYLEKKVCICIAGVVHGRFCCQSLSKLKKKKKNSQGKKTLQFAYALLFGYDYMQKEQPHVLAVDLGCGTGQLTRQLAPYFQEVVGFDISEAQLEEARTVAGYPNITYR